MRTGSWNFIIYTYSIFNKYDLVNALEILLPTVFYFYENDASYTFYWLSYAVINCVHIVLFYALIIIE